MINPQRGEIWLVDLNPTRGQEIQKTRPVVIISAELFNPIPSAGNILQVRSLSTERFVKQLGQVSDETLQELLSCLIVCVDYDPNL